VLRVRRCWCGFDLHAHVVVAPPQPPPVVSQPRAYSFLVVAADLLGMDGDGVGAPHGSSCAPEALWQEQAYLNSRGAGGLHLAVQVECALPVAPHLARGEHGVVRDGVQRQPGGAQILDDPRARVHNSLLQSRP
jgi:hypothetical protein